MVWSHHAYMYMYIYHMDECCYQYPGCYMVHQRVTTKINAELHQIVISTSLILNEP